MIIAITIWVGLCVLLGDMADYNISVLKRGLLLALIGLLHADHGMCQNFGSVGEQEVDASFVRALQLLSPDFHTSEDPKITERNLLKFHVLPLAISDTVNKEFHLQDVEVAEMLSTYLKLAENRFWEHLAYSKVVELSPEPHELAQYYETQKSRFSTPGNFTFLLAYVSDSTKSKQVQMVMKSAYQTYLSKGVFNKQASDGFTLSIEEDFSHGPDHFLSSILEQTKQGVISSAVKSGAFIVFILPIEAQYSKVLPFEEVRDRCVSEFSSRKRSEMEARFIEEALKKYPIRLSQN